VYQQRRTITPTHMWVERGDEMTLKDRILRACKADSIPEGESGLWSVNKFVAETDIQGLRGDKEELLPAGNYTYLRRLTTGTMHRNPPGEIVMEDTDVELLKHMNFMLKVYGRVLVTGLGLGCVVRGLLMNPAVESVVCIERSANVLKLVRDYMPKERLTVIHADALEWTKSNSEHFDCAYHDLWTDREAGEPHLQVWHGKLLKYCRNIAKLQGAWAFPHQLKRAYGRHIELA